MRRAITWFSLAAATSAAGTLSAQDTPAFEAGVELVAVPVFVTGRDGKAVPGLRPEHFAIRDQGKPVPVAAFLAVDTASPALPGTSATTPAAVAASRRQFLFLFDLTFSTPAGLTRAREASVSFLRQGLGPNDLVAVATFHPTGPKLLLGFTTDHAQAARAIATLGAVPGERPLRDPLGLALDLDILLTDPTGSLGIVPEDPLWRDQLLQQVRANRRAYTQRATSYVAALTGLGELLGTLQGRKQVVLFSAGFDQSILAGSENAERIDTARSVTEGRLWEVQSESYFGDASARAMMESLAEALAASDVVVHTVDTSGLVTGADAAELGPVQPGSGRGSLAQIAGDSGGIFVTNANDLTGGLQEVLDASRWFYVLAFEPLPSRKKPGELRKLEVEVRGDGLEVSHRRGYTLPEEQAGPGAGQQLRAAEIIAKGISRGPIALGVLAVPYRDAGEVASLPVVLQIDGQTLLGGEGAGSLAIEVYGYALDGEGHILDALGLTPTLDLDRLGAAVAAHGVQVLTNFRVVPGTVDLRFLVRDAASGRSGSLRLERVVPGFEEGALSLSPPLLTSDPRARVVIPAASRARPALEIPFRLGEQPFTAEPAPVLHGGETREVCLMVWPSPGERQLDAELLGSSGERYALTAGSQRLVTDADGVARYVARLTLDGVPPGDYRLRVGLEDPGGRPAWSELAVRVE